MQNDEVHIESFRTWLRLTVMGVTFVAFVLAQPYGGTWISYADIFGTVVVVLLIQYSRHYYFSEDGIERKFARCYLFKPLLAPTKPFFFKKYMPNDIEEVFVVNGKICKKMLVRLAGSKSYENQPLFLYRIQNISHTIVIFLDQKNPATPSEICTILSLYQ